MRLFLILGTLLLLLTLALPAAGANCHFCGSPALPEPVAQTVHYLMRLLP